MISVKGDPYLIEYNCRMGDPEAEVVLPRLETDLVGLFIAATQQELDTVKLRVDERSAVTIMAVSRGYPNTYEKGIEISGLNMDPGKSSLIFQAGTKKDGDLIITSGGRVLCVTSYGENIDEAAERSLLMLDEIHFEGIYYRTDIGYEFRSPVSR